MNATPTEVFNQMLVEPAAVTHAYFTEPSLGNIGQFADYDWGTSVDYTSLDEE